MDKLLADAHRSRLVSLGEFLEYVQALRDVGVRKGEAPVEAGGAVQLMTVHKAKGLEFPLVVIADATYQRRAGTGTVLVFLRVKREVRVWPVNLHDGGETIGWNTETR